MSTRRLGLATAVAAILACPWACASASAAVVFSPFELVSTDPALGVQAEYAYEPAISADGRFVAFTGVIASKNGVFRKDLATGELATVALGTGAGSPSISADGRYVSFTTSDNPVSGQTTSSGCTQVYRRDMDVRGQGTNPLEPGPESAYSVVSARSHSSVPLTYEGSEERGCPGGGSASANRVAISADGSKVAFTVIGRSNLTSKSEQSIETPENQVAVRDVETDETGLVSVAQGSEQPVAEGGALSVLPEISTFQRSTGGKFELSHDDASTAAISADGCTVAWMGVEIARQEPLEQAAGPEVLRPEPAYQYAEPLWRRIYSDGTSAGRCSAAEPFTPEPTRRVLAGNDPFCPPFCSGGLDLRWDEQPTLQTGEPQKGPRLGSYIAAFRQPLGERLTGLTPQLSADGEQVALLSTQPDYEDLPNFGLSQSDKEKVPDTNAFVVNMAPGLAREQAITRLTEWGSPDFSESSLDGAINEIAISADASRVAFATERNVFALAPPALITAPVTQLEPAQLYEDDLQAGTLALVSEGYNGEPANQERGIGGVESAALSEDGSVIALASGSSNLVFGSVNEGSAVYVTREQESPAVAGYQSVSPLPPTAPGEAEWSISATATPSSEGSLLIDVAVPGAGRLAASASAPVPVTLTVSGGSGKGSRARSKRATQHSGTAARAKKRTTTVIENRELAHASASSIAEGVLELPLLPEARYRSLAGARDGLFATITITFTAPGHPKLTETIQASFPRAPSHAKAAKRPARAARPKSKSSRGSRSR